MEHYTYQEVPGNKLRAANHDESNSLLVDIEESYVQHLQEDHLRATLRGRMAQEDDPRATIEVRNAHADGGIEESSEELARLRE
jgi:hypothetical protein